VAINGNLPGTIDLSLQYVQELARIALGLSPILGCRLEFIGAVRISPIAQDPNLLRFNDHVADVEKIKQGLHPPSDLRFSNTARSAWWHLYPIIVLQGNPTLQISLICSSGIFVPQFVYLSHVHNLYSL
jgi:hypothetical protein